MVDESFVDISLSDYRGQWTILLFYPVDFTFGTWCQLLQAVLADYSTVCPTEIISFSEHTDDFKRLNAQVLAISTDSHHTHLAWVRTPRGDGGVGRLNIPLVADTSKRIARSYGVLVTDENDDMYGAALRGLFIIDPTGTIRMLQVSSK